MRMLGWLVIVALAVWGLSTLGRALPPGGLASEPAVSSEGVPAVTQACKAQGAQLADYLAKFEKLGLVRLSGGRYEVDEARWAIITHDQKINVAIAAFCPGMSADGRGTLVLFGLHDGAAKASVVNGNYSDS